MLLETLFVSASVDARRLVSESVAFCPFAPARCHCVPIGHCRFLVAMAHGALCPFNSSEWK